MAHVVLLPFVRVRRKFKSFGRTEEGPRTNCLRFTGIGSSGVVSRSPE